MMEGFSSAISDFPMTDTLPSSPETIETAAPIDAAASEAAVTEAAAINTPAASKRPPKPDVFPVLEKMAALYPQLFGAVFLPLNRGIFQDLLEAHPDAFERESLKAALSMHTLSLIHI